MRIVILIVGALALVLNIVVGLIFSWYDWFNVALTSFVLLFNTTLMYMLSGITLKDGFRISLNCLIPFFTIIGFGAGTVSLDKIEDNPCIIVIVFLIFIEVVLIVAANAVSKNK